jgi:salicylate hydroxylase
MVLLIPDDMPLDGANTLADDVDEMRTLYTDLGQCTVQTTTIKNQEADSDWTDLRIPKLLALCKSVYKWSLCIRSGIAKCRHGPRRRSCAR